MADYRDHRTDEQIRQSNIKAAEYRAAQREREAEPDYPMRQRLYPFIGALGALGATDEEITTVLRIAATASKRHREAGA